MADSIYLKKLNYANILKENYTLYVGPTKSPDVVLGCGFDMNDVNNPRATGMFFNKIKPIKDIDNLETESDPQAYTYEIIKAQSVEEEMFKFSLHFSGNYGIVSGSLDYTKTEKHFNQNDIFYLTFEGVSNAETIKTISELEVTKNPKSEEIEDFEKRFRVFNSHHGSHFVRTIYYGSRFVIRAVCNKEEKQLSEKLELALKAIGSGWSAEGKMSSEHIKTLRNSKVEVSISIQGKLCSTTNELSTPIFRVIDYDTVFTLIEEIREGKAKIISCPIKCELESYKYYLSEFPKCEELFYSPIKSTIAKAPYGVPSGTIIAWLPSIENCSIDNATGKVLEIYPPEGWSICDKNSLYNLDGQFLRGVSSFDRIAKFEGNPNHIHTVTGETTEEYKGHWDGAEGADNGAARNWNHRHYIDNLPTSTAENIPPNFTVIYIIKI